MLVKLNGCAKEGIVGTVNRLHELVAARGSVVQVMQLESRTLRAGQRLRRIVCTTNETS